MRERKKQPKFHPKTNKNHWKYSLGPSQGLSGEARGPVWPQGGPGLEKGTKKPRNGIPFLAPKWRPGRTFREFFLLCFLRCSRCWFSMILVAQGPHFGFHFGSTLRALGLWENSWKCCKGCQFQRFGPCQTESFFRSWLWVRFGDLFLHFLWFLAVWELSFWELLGLIAVKKEVWKKDTKKE